MERVRVLIADDHEDFLEGIRDLLEPEFAVVGTAGDGQALLSAVENLKPDVVITDISMPQMSGIEAARIIMQKYPGIRIILITMYNNPVLVRQSLIAGVQGYVLKLKAVQELPLAIHQVLQGTPYISPLVKV
jgi:DNA-binding NarL/FixJ family response regulator